MKKLRFLEIVALAALIVFTLTGCSDDPEPFSGELIPPEHIIATPTSSSTITISWDAVPGALQYYVYYRSESGSFSRLGVALPTDTGVCSYTATGLSAGTTYYFTVSSVNQAGESPQSEEAITVITLIFAPANISAVAASSRSIYVTWAEVSGASGYYVYSTQNLSDPFTYLETTSSTSTTISDLPSDTTYYFRVSALDENGREGSQSTYASARTFRDPGNLNASADSPERIIVTWDAVSDSAVTGYEVWYSTSSDGTFDYLTMVEGRTNTSFAAEWLSSNTTYYFKVYAVNYNAGNTQVSYAYATTRLYAPENVYATTESSSSVTVNWSGVSEATFYYVYYDTNISADNYGGVAYSTSYTVTGLLSDTTYYFRVVAYNDNGNTSNASAYDSARTLLDTPTNVYASPVSSSSITVNWDGVSGATSYYVYYSTTYNGYFTYLGSSYTTSYTADYLSSNTTYYFKVNAQNNNNHSDDSWTTNTTTLLSTPTNVSASQASSSSITVSWNSVSGATDYSVYYSLDNSYFNYYGGTSSTSYTVNGLAENTTYYFRVSASNNNGNYSNTSSSASGKTLLATPANVSATAASSSSITVNWSPVSYATSYYLTDASGLGMTYTTSSTSYTVDGLAAGYLYSFRVTATGDNNSSSPSSTVSATTLSAGAGSETDPIPLPATNIWLGGSMASGDTAVWYSFTAEEYNYYYCWWNDSADGDYTQTLDVKVSAYYSNGTSIFLEDDLGWTYSSASMALSSGDTIKIKVEPKNTGDSGTFAIMLTTTSWRP